MINNTIKKEVSISGIGLHTGNIVNITFKPAGNNAGINFIRCDLPGRPVIKADVGNISSTERGTNLGSINTVEHVLSAFYALSITNIDVELDGPEPPVMDGSSINFCEMLLNAGIQCQSGDTGTISIKNPIYIIETNKTIIALPSNRFVVSFMINYPSDFVGSQFFKYELNEKSYIRDIAPARTYGFTREIKALRAQGLAKGASNDNAIEIGSENYKTKLRYPDELVRHKILDLIGDLSLVRRQINAHIICIRSGHSMNIKLAKALREVV
jgi:UDP-3-O-acyl N-acetylglucosamine deacetylase